MPCGLTKVQPGVGTLVCNNSGTTSHTGLHTATITARGKTTTWSWSAPATGQTIANTDHAPAFHKPQVVGQDDFA